MELLALSFRRARRRAQRSARPPVLPPARALPACIAAALALAACARLETRPENVCGNLTLEPENGEDCDGQEGCGAPGSEHACRFTCEAAPFTCPEADGYRCGVDGVCRRSSGEFEPMTTLVTSFTRDVLTEDINRDGCDEILFTTVRGTVVTALPSTVNDTCPASSLELPSGARPPSGQSVPPAPVLADLSNDDRPDLLLSARGFHGDALFVHLADATPTVTPLLYPTLRLREDTARPLAVSRAGGDILFLLLEPDEGMGGPPGGVTLVATVEEPESIGAILPEKLPGALSDLAFVVAEDLDAPASAEPPCDEIIAGFEGRPEILVYRTCDPAGAPALLPLAAVELAGGAKIRDRNGAIAVVDVNGDGRLDLLVNTSAPELHVAYGLGNGDFQSAPPGAGSVLDHRTSVFEIPPDVPGAEQLQAELTSPDSRFVAGHFFAGSPGVQLRALPCPDAGLTGSPGCELHDGACESVVTDVDADGVSDVVFTLGADPSIVVARGKTEEPHIALFATQCPPRGLAAGDFDGDGVGDVAFVDPRAANKQSTAQVSIVYGRALAVPESPVAAGRLELGSGLAAGKFLKKVPGDQIYAARIAAPGGPGGSGMGPADAMGAGVALVTDRGERVSSAGFYFPAPQGGMENLKHVELVAAAKGRFTAENDRDSRFGVAVVTRELASETAPAGESGTERLWRLVPHGAGGSTLDPVSGQSLMTPPCDACVLVPVKTDDDDLDEVLLLGAGEAIVYGVTENGFEVRATFATERSYRSLAQDDAQTKKYVPRPIARDLDGDGRDDVLLRAADGALVVLWGNEKGTFDEVPLSQVQGCEGTEICTGAFANVDADGELELVASSPEGTFLFEIDRAARELRPFGSGESILQQALPPAEDADFTTVRAGDFDGDGVDDLVLMRTSNFMGVLRGVPDNEPEKAGESR